MESVGQEIPRQEGVFRLGWLTPWRCRVILAALLVFGFVSHWRYLTHDCPIDLSGDEAHYWDWSRQLDLSYYSKGPLVAYLIRGSCWLLGEESMPAVRLPALVLAMGTSILTYWLAARLFQSERVALGAVLLNHLVPMFVAGSVMMTIDPPFFFCWALACCLAVKALFDGRRWAWGAMGVAIGVGFLAKYGMFLWLVGLGVYLVMEPGARKWLKTRWPWVMLVIALAFTTPVVVWNQRHDWVSLKHVERQTGASEGHFNVGNVFEALGGQLAAVGPALMVILGGAVAYALSRRGRESEDGRGMVFLVCMGLPYFALVVLWSVRAKIQVNWPAPAYFSLMILGAYFLGVAMLSRERWRVWRAWFWGTVIFGIACMPLAHNSEILYPAVVWIGHRVSGEGKLSEKWRTWDVTYKLRGWKELGEVVSRELETLRPGAMVMAENYDYTAEMAFYVKGQPRTYCAGSWFAEPKWRARHSQYDLWPDRRLDQPGLVGKDAIYFGHGDEDRPHEAPPDLIAAFESVEALPDVEIERRGFNVRVFHLWKCRGFKGMKLPADDGRH